MQQTANCSLHTGYTLNQLTNISNINRGKHVNATHQHQWSACGRSPGCPSVQQWGGCSLCPHHCRCCDNRCHLAHPMNSDCWRHSGWTLPALSPVPLGPKNRPYMYTGLLTPLEDKFYTSYPIWLSPDKPPCTYIQDFCHSSNSTLLPLAAFAPDNTPHIHRTADST